MQSTKTPRLDLADLWIVLAAGGAVLLYAIVGQGGFPLDDSWIHQTYARNLAQTGVWAFVPGVPSAASTSPLYTVVLAIGYLLGIQPVLWAHIVGGSALAVSGLLARRLAFAGMPRRGVGLAAGLAVATAWHLVWAAVSGMETMLFGMFTLVIVALARREAAFSAAGAWLRGALFGAAAALTTLARPEGLMLIGMAGVLLLLVWWLARADVNRRAIGVWMMTAAIAFVAVLAPYLVYNLNVTGGLLPDTAEAKQVAAAPFFLYSYPYRLGLMTMPLLAGMQILLIPGTLVFAVHRLQVFRERPVALLDLLLPTWGIALIALYAATLPIYFQHGRYVMPALPALITAGVAGTAYLLERTRFRAVPRVLVRTLSASAVTLAVVALLWIGTRAYHIDVQSINQEMVDPAHWLAANIPPEELLAVHDIGAIGYFASRPILDIAGLVSPEVVETLHDPPAMWALIEARGARYLMALPDQVPGDNVNDPRLCPIYQSEGSAAITAGGGKMTIYALAYDGDCEARLAGTPFG
jgi:hypothetical protein